MKFGINQSVKRSEDPRFLTGRGTFSDDVQKVSQTHALFLRSPYAHARITALDTTQAAAAPGVVGVYTAADLRADEVGDIPCFIPIEDRAGEDMTPHLRAFLTDDVVRYVGEGVAMVVAETKIQARDALELIQVEYDSLPAVTTADRAAREDAHKVWDDAHGNFAFHMATGDGDATDAAFAKAASVTTIDIINNRLVPSPMEPRAAIAECDPETGRYTLQTQTQNSYLVKRTICGFTLKIPEDDLRIVIHDVGGAFGAKLFHNAEEGLCLWAAGKLRRPVRWIGDRNDAFIADTHARDQITHAEAAVDENGVILAVRVSSKANMGAYMNCFAPFVSGTNVSIMTTGVYNIPAMHVIIEGFYTHTAPVDAYRGAGRPEAAYMIERLIDAVGRDMGLSQDEVRRRNFITPDAMPYTTPADRTYDSGDYATIMDGAMKAADWDGFDARRADCEARGTLRGIGMATYVEICAGGPDEEATFIFNDDGSIDLLLGTQAAGQGHATSYAQIAVETLGVEFESINVIEGDTDRIPFGGGTAGSRSITTGGAAIELGAKRIVEKGRTVAARLLQADTADVQFEDGRFSVNGSDQAISLTDIATAAREDASLLPDPDPEIEAFGSGLDTRARFTREAPTYPNGCHICELEIDPATGATKIVGYVVVDDLGTLINPMMAAGQIHGGIAQGIGQALLEEAVYDADSGQMLNASLMDYALPRAGHLPNLDLTFNEDIPCVTNPLGVKGAGEAGTIGSCPAVINAVVNALATRGVHHIDMPATSEKVWRAINGTSA